MSQEAHPPTGQSQSAPRIQDTAMVRTQLIHRKASGPIPWWHTAVVGEVPGVLDQTAAQMLSDMVGSFQDVGFDAIVLRPALIDLNKDASQMVQLIESAHASGLKVLIRLAGADHTPGSPKRAPLPFYGFEESTQNTIARAEAVLRAGADGIDLGRIGESAEDPRADQEAHDFTELVLRLMAELSDYSADHIIAAEASTDIKSNYDRHLEEEWMHHLRDDRLQKVAFKASDLIEAITTTVRERDRIGAPSVWKAMLPCLVTSPVVENIYPSSWEDGANTARRASMRIILAGLPGAVYLPFGFSGGHVEFDGVAVRPSMASSPAEKARVLHTKLALKLRQKHDLGNASFAWAQGLPWQNRDAAVFLSGDIMCVVNTSDEALHVPLEHQLLLRSDSTKDDAIPASPTVLKTGSARIFTNTEREKQNCLSPGTTAWFKPARIQASGL